MNKLHKYQKFNYLQRYCLYKALGLQVPSEVLISLMDNRQRGLVLQMESLSTTR